MIVLEIQSLTIRYLALQAGSGHGIQRVSLVGPDVTASRIRMYFCAVERREKFSLM